MSLTVGQQVVAETGGGTFTVQKKLGEGGQGAVWLASGSHGDRALKWYNPEQATEGQRTAVRFLVSNGPPRGPGGARFVWPEDVVTAAGMSQFGYLMPLVDTDRYADLGEVWARRKPVPSFPALCEISYQAVNSYRTLHLSGLCYRDISRGNIVFDPVTGDVLICDNDNVGVNRQSDCQVWGTLEYMAPELVRGEAAHPSTETDLHSLAVLLFLLWVSHHPMHGQLEYQIRMWDLPAKKLVYGVNPVFVFDPTDHRNRLPNDPGYAPAARRWSERPKGLRDLFTRAFTVGLRAPTERVTEGEWQALFTQLKDGAIDCPGCRAANLWEPGATDLVCWHCKKPITIPPRLAFPHAGGTHLLLLTRTAKVRRRHVDPIGPDGHAEQVIGEVAQHPAKPSVWGLRNLTSVPWVATTSDGQSAEVPPQKSAPLTAGLKVNIGGTVATVMT